MDTLIDGYGELKMIELHLEIPCRTRQCVNMPFRWASHQHKYVYFETPKCCSSTLKWSLPDCKEIRRIREDKLEEYFKFSFVRNPWDKMVSLYFSFFRRKEGPTRKARTDKILRNLFGKTNMPFHEFIRTFPKLKDHHWAQHSDYLEGFELDFIGRFENFAEDLLIVQEEIGVQLKPVHRHKTDHKKYTEYYTPGLVDIVAEAFPDDIERFGYEFGD